MPRRREPGSRSVCCVNSLVKAPLTHPHHLKELSLLSSRQVCDVVCRLHLPSSLSRLLAPLHNRGAHNLEGERRQGQDVQSLTAGLCPKLCDNIALHHLPGRGWGQGLNFHGKEVGGPGQLLYVHTIFLPTSVLSEARGWLGKLFIHCNRWHLT